MHWVTSSILRPNSDWHPSPALMSSRVDGRILPIPNLGAMRLRDPRDMAVVTAR